MTKSPESIRISTEIFNLGIRLELTPARWNPDTKQWDYLATLNNLKYRFTTEYHCGAGWKDEKTNRPIAPSLADILSCLLLNSSAVGQTFNQWCGEYGYDTDSRKALETYDACIWSGEQTNELLGDKKEAVQALLQDY